MTMLKRGLFSLVFTFLFIFGASLPARAGEFQLEAPGGLEAGKDGSISAFGLPGKPLRAMVGGYELTARRLFYDARQRMVTFNGEVFLRGQEKGKELTLQAETMAIDLDRQVVRAEGRVLFTGEEMTATAESLVADLRKDEFSFLGAPAVARYRESRFTARRIRYDRKVGYLTLDEEVGWEITRAGEKRFLQARHGEYDRSSGLVRMVGLVAVDGALRLQAERMVYEEKTGAFGLENVQVEEGDGGRSLAAPFLQWVPAEELMTASGGVVFRDGPYTVSAREAVYEMAARQVVFRYEVCLERGGDFLTGDEVRYDLAQGMIRVSGGARARITLKEET